jgi:hypothetical protein
MMRWGSTPSIPTDAHVARLQVSEQARDVRLGQRRPGQVQHLRRLRSTFACALIFSRRRARVDCRQKR